MESMGMGKLLVVCGTILLATAMGVGGCTITVKNANDNYTSTMNQCMERGGSWVPRGYEGTCILMGK